MTNPIQDMIDRKARVKDLMDNPNGKTTTEIAEKIQTMILHTMEELVCWCGGKTKLRKLKIEVSPFQQNPLDRNLFYAYFECKCLDCGELIESTGGCSA